MAVWVENGQREYIGWGIGHSIHQYHPAPWFLVPTKQFLSHAPRIPVTGFDWPSGSRRGD